MSYWVYENTIHKKARIHAASCSFCGDGRGIHGGGKTTSGYWHGPFSEIESADACARETRQTDVRGCSICIGSAAGVGPSNTTSHQATKKDMIKRPMDQQAPQEFKCTLSLSWAPLGWLSLDGNGRVTFPPVEAISGLYRFAAQYPDGRLANYIGESDNLRRRFGNYRNPGPSQPTSLRINAWLKELFVDGGEVFISIADRTFLNGEAAEISKKATRRMFEQMAIALEHAEDVESLNR